MAPKTLSDFTDIKKPYSFDYPLLAKNQNFNLRVLQLKIHQINTLLYTLFSYVMYGGQSTDNYLLTETFYISYYIKIEVEGLSFPLCCC